MPLGPSTATRSPNQISVSNGSVSPCSSSRSIVTALRPVRCPPSLTVTFCSWATSGSGLAARNWRSRLSAAFSLGANASEMRARILISFTRSSSRSRSSVHSARSLVRLARWASRAAWYDANPAPWVHAPVGSTVTIRVAQAASSSRSWLTNRMVLGQARSWPSSQRFPGMSRKLSGSSSSSTSWSPLSSACSTSFFCSPPENVGSGRSASSS